MLLLPHAIVGATLAAKISNPLISLPLALVFHFVSDLVPHWNPHITQEMEKYHHLTRRTRLFILADTFLSLIVGLTLAFKFYPDFGKIIIVTLGCFFAVLPDLVESPYYFWGIKNKYLGVIMKFQKKMQFNVELPWGIITQIIVVAVCFWLLSK